MKRYGDNLPCSNDSEDEPRNDDGRNAKVMYGGCGASFGAFPKRGQPVSKRKVLNLWSLFGFKRNKTKTEKC